MEKKLTGWFLSGRVKNQEYLNDKIDVETNKYAETKNIETMFYSTEDFVIVSGEDNKLIYKGEEITEYPDFVIAKRYDNYVLRLLELNGVKCFNTPEANDMARNKMLAYQLLVAKGLPVPKTISQLADERTLTYEELLAIFGSKEFVVKGYFGHQGDAVYLVKNKAEFDELMKIVGKSVFFQEYIKSSYGRDLRAYVIGGKYKGAAMRKSENDFRSNLALGGKAYAYPYDPEAEEIAIAAAEALNLDIAGVDLLFGENGYVVCEINAFPGFKSFKMIDPEADGFKMMIDLAFDKLN